MRFLLLSLIGAAAVFAQDTVVVSEWRMKVGDDPRWAAADVDDSGWDRTEWPSYPREPDFQWYRATAAIPPELRTQPLGIAIPPLREVYEVYINGVSVGRFGTWSPKPAGYFRRYMAFRIPEGVVRDGPVHIAVRHWLGRPPMGFSSLDTIPRTTPSPEIGPLSLIQALQRERQLNALVSYSANRFGSLGMLAAGLIGLALSVAPLRKEGVWLSSALILEGSAPLLGFAVDTAGGETRSLAVGIVAWLQYGAHAAWTCFLARICRQLYRPLTWVGALQIAVSTFSIWAFVTQPEQASDFATWLLNTELSSRITLGAALAATVVTLLPGRAEREAIVLSALTLLLPLTTFVYRLFPAWQRLQVGGQVIDPRYLTRLAVSLGVMAVLYARYRREQQKQRIIEQELSAARMVQEALLAGGSQGSDRGSWFAVSAAYLPASEVGGDFYQELPGEDGSVLVMVGDVSGKGLKAALLVGHVSGALSNEPSREPGEVLRKLNQALVGRSGGGFVTCCCARFDRDGWVTVANAGHPSPYLDGREVEVEAGLPLGVVAGVEYSERRVRLGEESQMTLVSDGVVEAADSKGELFGFERTREVSGKSAAAIAEAAREWGQTDDITVVTVRRAVA